MTAQRRQAFLQIKDRAKAVSLCRRRCTCPRSEPSAIWSAQNAHSRSSIALKLPPSAPLCRPHVDPLMLSLRELFSWLASVWSTSRREGHSRPRKPQSAQRHRSTSDTSRRGRVRQWIAGVAKRNAAGLEMHCPGGALSQTGSYNSSC